MYILQSYSEVEEGGEYLIIRGVWRVPDNLFFGGGEARWLHLIFGPALLLPSRFFHLPFVHSNFFFFLTSGIASRRSIETSQRRGVKHVSCCPAFPACLASTIIPASLAPALFFVFNENFKVPMNKNIFTSVSMTQSQMLANLMGYLPAKL